MFSLPIRNPFSVIRFRVSNFKPWILGVREVLWTLYFMLLMCGGLMADSLVWDKTNSLVSCDLRGQRIDVLLTNIAMATGWEVLVEPGTELEISVKFDRLPVFEALERLLRGVNYALVGGTNGVTRLYVFKTSMAHATQPIISTTNAGVERSGLRTETNRVPNELVVRVRPGVSIDEIAVKFGAQVIGRLDKYRVYRFRFNSVQDLERLQEMLGTIDGVQSVDYNYQIPMPETPLPVQAGMVSPVLLKHRSDSSSLVIGLVDTSVQVPSELQNLFLPSVDILPARTEAETPTHGTAMALTLLRALGIVTGGEASVKILPVNVFGESQMSTTFDVAAGIAAAVNDGAQIINLSLGTPIDSPVLKGVVEEVTRQGVVIVAAAGNEPTTVPVYPAAYSSVVAVTALDPATGTVAPYANRGDFVDMAAPGISAVPYGGKVYVVVGTSPAAAYVTGLLAGLANKSGQSPSEVKEQVVKTATAILGK